MIIKATIGSASITYTIPAATTVEQVVANFVSLWNDSTIPEFQEIEAAAVANGTFTLTMETSSAGKPFIVSIIIGNGTNEKQTVTIGNGPTGGTFTLAYEEEVTTGIAPDASAATVQAALEALPAIGAGNVLVTGVDGGPWTIEFIGDLAGDNASLLEADASDLLTVAPEIQVIDLLGATGGTFTARYGINGTPTAALAYNISAADLQTALEGLTPVGAGNVTVSGVNGGPFTLTFSGTLTNTNTQPIVIDGDSLTGGLADSVSVAETQEGGVAAAANNETWTIWDNTDATDGRVTLVGDSSVTGGTFTVTINLGEGAPGFPTELITLSSVPYDVTAAEFQALMDTQLAAKGAAYTKRVFIDFNSAGDLNADSKLSEMSAGTGFRINVPASLEGAKPLSLTIYNAGLTGGSYSSSVSNNPSAWSGSGINDFKLAITDGSTEIETGFISQNANAASLVSALEAHTHIGVGNVSVEVLGDSSDGSHINEGYRITFIGELAGGSTGLEIISHLGINPDRDINIVKNWSGVPGTVQSEIQTVSVAGSPASGDFVLRFNYNTAPLENNLTHPSGFSAPISYDQTAFELQGILEAVDTIGAGNVTCAGGPFPDSDITVTFKGDLAEAAVSLMTVEAADAETTSQGGSELPTVDVVTVQSTIQHETTVPNSGPHDWNTDANWDTEEKPVNTDDVLIPDGDNILYGLDQSDLILGLLHFTAPDTQMGLPRRNANDDIEYLQRFLKVTAAEIIIESGSQLINIDVMDSSPAIEVLNSGTGQDGEHAVQIIGQNTANTLSLLVLNGDVGVATGPKEAAYVKTITQRGGQVWIGQDVGLEDIERTGGLFRADRTTIDGLITL
ncbi:hypothetical protein [Gimesia sp.]|uniref:hypothetical protein n=1 Tax=Gimesia sp. TaxID=2024833 RepID=UPI003A94E897